MTIRVAICDDQALVRDGLRVQLGYADDIEVVGEASDGEQAVALARRERPDVLLMDVRMPRLDGIAATRLVVADPACAGVRVLVLTTFDVDETVFAALAAGASGFLLKDATPEEIVHGVRVVAAGESLLAPSVTSLLVREYARRPTSGRPRGDLLAALTERETEVLHARRPGALQRRDRRPARHQPRHGQDARQPRARQARRPGPRPAGRPRLRGRPRRARHLTAAYIPGCTAHARGTRRRCTPRADDRASATDLTSVTCREGRGSSTGADHHGTDPVHGSDEAVRRRHRRRRPHLHPRARPGHRLRRCQRRGQEHEHPSAARPHPPERRLGHDRRSALRASSPTRSGPSAPWSTRTCSTRVAPLATPCGSSPGPSTSPTAGSTRS